MSQQGKRPAHEVILSVLKACAEFQAPYPPSQDSTALLMVAQQFAQNDQVANVLSKIMLAITIPENERASVIAAIRDLASAAKAIKVKYPLTRLAAALADE